MNGHNKNINNDDYDDPIGNSESVPLGTHDDDFERRYYEFRLKNNNIHLYGDYMVETQQAKRNYCPIGIPPIENAKVFNLDGQLIIFRKITEEDKKKYPILFEKGNRYFYGDFDGFFEKYPSVEQELLSFFQ